MKYRFGNNNLITGYIKNLLHEFNLPQAKVITSDDMPRYDNKFYIKERKIYYGKNDKPVGVYGYGNKIPNFTKNLIINSSVYDSYTHRYLGDFLRFIRDYRKLDLMPLYNCFSNESPYDLKLTLDLTRYEESSEGTKEVTSYFRVDTSSNLYNYYIIPVKFNTKYNIAIESGVPYEMCAMIYTGSQVLKISKQLMKQTYKLIGTTKFSQPFTYSVNVSDEPIPNCNYERFTDYEENLRILLKIPKSVKSSIAVIEGDILNTKMYADKIPSRIVYNEEEVIKKENGYEIPSYNDLKISTNLSLLSLNDGVSYPFADRLVEYLLRNAINNTERLQYNIGWVQGKLYPKYGEFKGFYDVWNTDINYRIHNFISEPMKNNFATIGQPEGSEGAIKSYKDYTDDGTLLVDYSKFAILDMYKDLLGYVDKDVEYHMEAL